jgi:hypothetical protein
MPGTARSLLPAGGGTTPSDPAPGRRDRTPPLDRVVPESGARAAPRCGRDGHAMNEGAPTEAEVLVPTSWAEPLLRGATGSSGIRHERAWSGTQTADSAPVHAHSCARALLVVAPQLRGHPWTPRRAPTSLLSRHSRAARSGQRHGTERHAAASGTARHGTASGTARSGQRPAARSQLPVWGSGVAYGGRTHNLRSHIPMLCH